MPNTVKSNSCNRNSTRHWPIHRKTRGPSQWTRTINHVLAVGIGYGVSNCDQGNDEVAWIAHRRARLDVVFGQTMPVVPREQRRSYPIKVFPLNLPLSAAACSS